MTYDTRLRSGPTQAQINAKRAAKADRVAALSVQYPDLTVAQLDTLDTLGDRCQNCGSTFTIDVTAEKEVPIHPGYHVVGTELPVKRVQCTVAFCNGCEFAVELR